MQKHGLGKIISVYFPGFTASGLDPEIEMLLGSLDAKELRELRLLLWIAALSPAFVFKLLHRCEDEEVPQWMASLLGPAHIQIKSLCSLLYFSRQ